MIDGSNAFYLEMDRGAESIETRAFSLCAEKVAGCKNYSDSKEIKAKGHRRRNVIF